MFRHITQHIANRKELKIRKAITRRKLLIYQIALGYGYWSTDKTVEHMLADVDYQIRHQRSLRSEDELRRFFDPSDPSHFGMEPEFAVDSYMWRMVRPRFNVTPELTQKVIETQIGDQLFETVKISISHHDTAIFDGDGELIARFYGAGRKMHYSSATRAFNAQQVLLLFGIGYPIDDIAVQDLSPTGYKPLVFELRDGAWASMELEAIPG